METCFIWSTFKDKRLVRSIPMLPGHMGGKGVLAWTMFATITAVIANVTEMLGLNVLGEICGPFRSVATVQTSP